MSLRTAVAALALLAALGGGAGAQQAGAPAGLFGNPRRFTEPTGADIFRGVCAGCHMANGRGAQGAGAYPSLVADASLKASDYPVEIVLHGLGAMPPFGGMLTDRQVADVVAYIRRNFGNDYVNDPTPADVAAAR